MVGGGPEAFFGDVHRRAVAFDGRAALAAGCFSTDFQKTLSTGETCGIAGDRLYASYEEMADEEAGRPDKIDFVTIVTPNHTHFSISKLFLENGIHVVCEKPLTIHTEEAETLNRIVRDRDLLFCVTYTYTGYPMIKHAKDLIREGRIGHVRFVNVEYPQEWLATPVEKKGNKQAVWRTDPVQTGISSCVADIGCHIENIVTYLTGLKIQAVCARLDTIVEGRLLDDNATIMVQYDTGATGLYWCSQIAIGYENGLKVRIIGSKGSVEWAQENPNYLNVSYLDKPKELISRRREILHDRARYSTRLPAGHPEGLYEALANVYTAFINAWVKKQAGKRLTEDDLDFPGIEHGLKGVRFIAKCVESSRKGAVWVDMA